MIQEKLKEKYLKSILENLNLESKVKLVIDILEQIDDDLFFNGYYEEHNKINEFIETLKEGL